MADVKKLMENSVGKIKESHWKAAINHVIKWKINFGTMNIWKTCQVFTTLNAVLSRL